MTILYWIRNDLRLDDNAALSYAVQEGAHLLIVWVWDPEAEKPWAPGAASQTWLDASLRELRNDLHAKQQQLIVRQGDSATVLLKLAHDINADHVVWNDCWEPSGRRRDRAVHAALKAAGLDVKTFKSGLLFDPESVTNKQGGPYQVFTPFWKHCVDTIGVSAPLKPPRALTPLPAIKLPEGTIDEIKLRPSVRWDKGIHEAWAPGERHAHERLKQFLANGIKRYKDQRDCPGEDGVSRLSPYLHFGEITPSRIWDRIHSSKALQASGAAAAQADAFTRQLCWREFAHHLLYHFPDTTDHPLRPEFNDFPWNTNASMLEAWQKGRTGYPIVDAGMRELWQTGWMHNRVRMIVASFLTKDLMIPWQEGTRWFWDTLVDADLANNTLGWQWTAGCGADAAPYFRVFNPVSQGNRYDPDGAYVRRWVPEIADLPDPWIHRPWEADSDVLSAAGVTLDVHYPKPIVDHAAARTRALRAYDKVKKKGA